MRMAEELAAARTERESGDHVKFSIFNFQFSRPTINFGSRLMRPRGDSVRSRVKSFVPETKATLEPSGARVGKDAPVLVVAFREGTEGKSVA